MTENNQPCVCVRHACEVLEVLPPHSSGKSPGAQKGRPMPVGGDTIIISDSEDDLSDPSGQMSCSLGQRSDHCFSRR